MCTRDAISHRIWYMTDLVMVSLQCVAKAFKGISNVSWIIDWDDNWRKKNDYICRLQVSYDREPVERIMNKSNGLLWCQKI